MTDKQSVDQITKEPPNYAEVEEEFTQKVVLGAPANDPDATLAFIDAWCADGKFMMHVGDVKGKILTEAVKARAPETVVEFGLFMGYSAIRIAREASVKKLYSLDIDEGRAEKARRIIAHAGLADKIEARVGPKGAEGLIADLAKDLGKPADLIFIDHVKHRYHLDLQIAEQAGLVGPGTTVVADNIIYPGAPDYMDYVRSRPDIYDTELITSELEYTPDVEDAVAISKCKADPKQ